MFFLPGHGMEWKTIFPSIFHSILSYQGMFKPEATRNLYCIFATLSVPL